MLIVSYSMRTSYIVRDTYIHCQTGKTIPKVVFVAIVQSLSRVQLFVTLWTAARKAFLFITNSQSLLKLMPLELVMPYNRLILCHPLLLLPSIFPASGSFPMSWLLASGGQSIGALASASVLPMSIQD